MSKKGEVSLFTLIEPGKKNIPSFKDQGCDVRSVGRSSRSMRQQDNLANFPTLIASLNGRYPQPP